MNARLFAITLSCVGALGCALTSAPSNLDPCSGTVAVAVAVGPVPNVSWSPACGMSYFSVATVPPAVGAPEDVMWSI
jgi:hypothetical protein